MPTTTCFAPPNHLALLIAVERDLSEKFHAAWRAADHEAFIHGDGPQYREAWQRQEDASRALINARIEVDELMRKIMALVADSANPFIVGASA